MLFLKKIENYFKHPLAKIIRLALNIKNKKGKNNHVYIIDKNGKKHKANFYQFILVEFSGENNIIEICESSVSKFKNSIFYINGNNNYVKFGENARGLHNIEVNIRGNNSKLITGSELYCGKVNFYIYGDSSVIIGDKCMFSFDVYIWATDGHKIYDKDKNLINQNKDVKIGNHVWICRGATMLKGSGIGDECVLGNSSMLTKDYSNYTHCILAGNTAKIVKEDIIWEE